MPGFSLVGALTGGVSAPSALASDSGLLDPTTQPVRQKVVGTYDLAGFPKYTNLADGVHQQFVGVSIRRNTRGGMNHKRVPLQASKSSISISAAPPLR